MPVETRIRTGIQRIVGLLMGGLRHTGSITILLGPVVSNTQMQGCFEDELEEQARGWIDDGLDLIGYGSL